ncbi:MAG: hypothetical protein QXQ03_00520 [Candidatus Nezhaarchaeales archaeon]
MEQKYSLSSEELLILEGDKGFIGITKAGKKGFIYLASPSSEVLLPYEEDYIFAIAIRKPGRPLLARCMIHLARDLEAPVVVLPKGHPSLKRSVVLLTIGREVEVTSKVEGGADPRIGVLCPPSPELDGLFLVSVEEGVLVRGALSRVRTFIERL